MLFNKMTLQLRSVLTAVFLVVLIFSCSCQTPSCNPPCATCIKNATAPNNCATCMPAYYLSGAQCLACQVKYCITCKTATTCSLCQNNFVASNNTCVCRNQYVPNNSTTNTSCICNLNSTKLSQTDSCFVCNIGECLSCSANNVCQTCAVG